MTGKLVAVGELGKFLHIQTMTLYKIAFRSIGGTIEGVKSKSVESQMGTTYANPFQAQHLVMGATREKLFV